MCYNSIGSLPCSPAKRSALISSTRRRGAQPGNTNAVKHGFYARKFNHHRLKDYDRARRVSGLEEEIALLRLVILNLAQSCLPAGAPPDLAACHALEASLARLAHLLKDQRLLNLGAADPADVLAALFASANTGLPFTGLFPPVPDIPSPLGTSAGSEPLLPSPMRSSSSDWRGGGGEGSPSSSEAKVHADPVS